MPETRTDDAPEPRPGKADVSELEASPHHVLVDESAADVDQSAAQIVSALSEQGRTVAVAESLTGGMVSASLVAIAGASAVLRGAVVAYAVDVKRDVLGVDPDLLSANGPVDPEVAAQMAHGVRRLLKADFGLATTGVAGPGPADGAPAGRVFVAVAGALPKVPEPATDQRFYLPVGHGEITAAVLRLDLPGDRAAVRLGSTGRVLELLADLIR
ncbi:nicotinamide-nucleotide amidase [Kineosporia succinea]|uniref:Nicotinamide-nucleotide amidase n=1 Tax=Kineosporia succinea TaxID=84632 RepID=A0ABT9NW54_9ACTN|nr:CinA family protein [Kineosporia succinea]MDP9824652.1 nicotinamide-nucleotide amidase [Kineosporia succinea]